MDLKTLKYELLLLLTAAIWGFAFVAQVMGMEYIGPYLFNGIRFGIGVMVLLPLLYYKRKEIRLIPKKYQLLPGLILGVILFTAAALQQVGIVYTTAGNAGFITTLYVVMVPVLGLLIGKKVNRNITIGIILAVVGFYFLCIKADASVNKGDLLVLAGAVLWAVHVLVIDYYSTKTSAILLAVEQFAVCSIISLVTAFFTESWDMQAVKSAALPIAYGGLLSVGVAYTLQVVSQKFVHPAPAAVILSLESVFAVIGGWLILSEELSMRALGGCILIFAGVIVCQLGESGKKV